VEFLKIGATGPAGSINSSVADMAHWLMFNLDQGVYGGKRLLSAQGVKELHAPHIILPQNERHPEITFSSYGLGWATSSYRGFTTVHHGGGTAGFTARVALIPSRRLGAVVLTNLSGSSLPDIIGNYIFDRLLGLEPIDWSQCHQELVSQTAGAQSRQDEALRLGRRPDTSPSHPLEEYVGVYRHPGAGLLTITAKDQTLAARYGMIDLALTHHHFDTFEARFEVVGNAMTLLANFSTDTLGRVGSVTMPLGLEGGAPDLVFERVIDQSPGADPHYYTGDYEVAGLTITVGVRGDGKTLVVTWPGQPGYELVPAGGHNFEVRGPQGVVGGVRVHFTGDGGQAATLVLVQPTSAFTAQRKPDSTRAPVTR